VSVRAQGRRSLRADRNPQGGEVVRVGDRRRQGSGFSARRAGPARILPARILRDPRSCLATCPSDVYAPYTLVLGGSSLPRFVGLFPVLGPEVDSAQNHRRVRAVGDAAPGIQDRAGPGPSRFRRARKLPGPSRREARLDAGRPSKPPVIHADRRARKGLAVGALRDQSTARCGWSAASDDVRCFRDRTSSGRRRAGVRGARGSAMTMSATLMPYSSWTAWMPPA
jgi:hypothetical protein